MLTRRNLGVKTLSLEAYALGFFNLASQGLKKTEYPKLSLAAQRIQIGAYPMTTLSAANREALCNDQALTVKA
jgi:hypothetical protein